MGNYVKMHWSWYISYISRGFLFLWLLFWKFTYKSFFTYAFFLGITRYLSYTDSPIDNLFLMLSIYHDSRCYSLRPNQRVISPVSCLSGTGTPLLILSNTCSWVVGQTNLKTFPCHCTAPQDIMPHSTGLTFCLSRIVIFCQLVINRTFRFATKAI